MNIRKIIYLYCGETSENMFDHRRYAHNLSSCEIKASKNSGLNGIRKHEFFSGASMINHVFISTVQIQVRPYVHLHSFTFYGCITNSQCDQLPDALIAQSVEQLKLCV